MGASDLRVSVAMSRLRCVLEPALVLAHPLGARLALCLAQAFEVWLTRSFWRTIDTSELLLRGPLAAYGAQPPCLPDVRALADWTALRDSTDAGSWLMRWVGDCVAESQLQTRAEGDLVERFEWLAAGLESPDPSAQQAALPAWWQPLDLRAGSCDAAALSAALDGAMILCLLPHDGSAPWPVQALKQRGLPAAFVPDDEVESLFATERQLVRQALASAGVAVLMQSLPPPAVVHVLVDTGVTAASADEADRWSNTQTWWYRL